jgi:hypothetical protein
MTAISMAQLGQPASKRLSASATSADNGDVSNADNGAHMREYPTHELAEVRREPTTIPGSLTPFRYVAVCVCGVTVGPCGSSSAQRARRNAKELHARHAAHALEGADDA